jgi:hypothetical protein
MTVVDIVVVGTILGVAGVLIILGWRILREFKRGAEGD